MDYIRLIALMQAAFIIGKTVAILYYYKRKQDVDPVKVHTVLLISVSYILFLIGTMITVFRSVYNIRDYWYWIIGAGYLIGDLSIIIAWRIQIKRKRKK